ncbi:MAG: hypothetical protein IJ899_18725 [Blautia sp.]|nr:hypothetical protein [Blautia sp.]
MIHWLYEKATGIRHEEACPGYERAIIAPIPDRRPGWLEAALNTRHGRIRSR